MASPPVRFSFRCCSIIQSKLCHTCCHCSCFSLQLVLGLLEGEPSPLPESAAPLPQYFLGLEGIVLLSDHEHPVLCCLSWCMVGNGKDSILMAIPVGASDAKGGGECGLQKGVVQCNGVGAIGWVQLQKTPSVKC